MISEIIAGRGNNMTNMKRTVSCFLHQTYKEKELLLIIDQEFTPGEYKQWIDELFDGDQEFPQNHNIHIFSNLNAQFHHNNVGSMRNLWAQKAKGKFILFMDDDEDIPDDYMERHVEYWKKYRNLIKKDFVLTPTLMYRHTGTIQNQGFSHFNYFLSRPIGYVLGQREWAEIQMYSWNSLFAPAVIFQNHPMDERFDFIYEDLAYSYGLYAAGIPLLVTKEIEVYHMERDKTKLEHAWVGNAYQAYKKSKHRILFVRKFWNIYQKFQFFLLWFRGQPLWLILKVLFSQSKDKRVIIKSILKGTHDGWKSE